MQSALFAVAATLCAALPTCQEPPATPLFREFALVQRLQVVCAHRHFGRVLDLIAEVPSGVITGAVVTMRVDAGERRVVVPFANLRYDAAGHLLQLEGCADDAVFPAFEAGKLEVRRSGDDGAVTGAVLVSALANAKLQLDGGATGSTQGATVELSSGHVAFLHMAASTQRAGDAELHATPWAALTFVDGAAADDAPTTLAIRLAKTAAALTDTPALNEAILSDPLYRPFVYRAFGVPPPDYDDV
ncbi:MAG: hypothetical protein R3F29_12940 [Planctomycetota bacterium]